MSYNEFLNSFIGVISLFVNGIKEIANTLSHNYIFITLIGLVMFSSLFWLIYHFVFNFFDKLIYGYEEYNDLYENYVLKKRVQDS